MKRGFTLIELLVVIAIIGVLSAVVLSSLNSTRNKSRDAIRLSNFKELEKALAIYYEDNGIYPDSGNTWNSTCSSWGGLAPSAVIPGLVPKYIAQFPDDPASNGSGTNCILYQARKTGNTWDYKILDLNLDDSDNLSKQPTFLDPRRNSGNDKVSNPCGTQSTAKAWAIWSSDTSRCW